MAGSLRDLGWPQQLHSDLFDVVCHRNGADHLRAEQLDIEQFLGNLDLDIFTNLHLARKTNPPSNLLATHERGLGWQYRPPTGEDSRLTVTTGATTTTSRRNIHLPAGKGRKKGLAALRFKNLLPGIDVDLTDAVIDQ